MSTHEFLTTVTAIFAVMGVIAAVEVAVPMFARSPAERGHGRVNLALTAVTLTLNWLLTATAALIALAFSFDGSGLMAQLGLPLALQVVAGVALLDFSFGYAAHRLMHNSAFLWRVHRVHHCDPFVDVTTTYRNHPIEGVWRFLFVIIPVWVLGLPPEAVMIHRLLSALNGILEHANVRVWRPLDRALSLAWVTPHMHKVHHSRACVETDSNFGNLLSIYDRLLRTFTPTDRALAVAYGLDDTDRRQPSSLPALLVMPFQEGRVAAHPVVTATGEKAI